MSSSLEDRVRDAYGLAKSWGPAVPPPLRVPASSASGRRRSGRRSTTRSERTTRRRSAGLARGSAWLAAPLGAALAVGLVVVGAVHVSDSGPGPDPAASGGENSGTAQGSTQTAGAAPSATRFFLAQAGDTEDGAGFTPNFGVYSSGTGKLVAPIALRPALLTAAGDGRTYFAAVPASDQITLTFHRIRISRNGNVESVSKLPIAPQAAAVDFLAASRDGTKLALAVQPYSRCDESDGSPDCLTSGELRVADVRTGRVSTWRTTLKGSVGGLSLDAAGRLAVFSWSGYGGGNSPGGNNGGDNQVRSLDLRSPGRDLFGGRRITPKDRSIQSYGPLSLTPDGSSVAVAVVEGSRSQYDVLGFDVPRARRTGMLLAQPEPVENRLEYLPPGAEGATVHSVIDYDSEGKALLVHGGGYILSILSERRLTRLKSPIARDEMVVAAW